jgi:hypothetical protein
MSRKWWAVVVLGLALFSCNRASSRPITTPSGERGFAIRCRGDQTNCFEEAGEVCPRGYDILEDARDTSGVQITSGYATGISVDKKFSGQMLVKCTSGDSAAQDEQRDTPSRQGRTRYAASAPPTGSLGVRLGSSTDEFSAACEVAGRSFEATSTGGRCDGVITSADFAATTTVTSCDKRICYLLLEISLSSIDDSQVASLIGRLRDQLLQRYSAPTEVTFDVPAACGKALAKCLKEDRAHIAHFWKWETGEVVNFVVTPNSIFLGYGNREGVRARLASGL